VSIVRHFIARKYLIDFGFSSSFYVAHLVSSTGTIPPYDVFKTSGPTHAQVYWDLISHKEQLNWDYR